MTEFRIAVRELAEFCHRSGDIDYRFTPAPTARDGIEGHQAVQGRRGVDYRPEYPLEGSFDCAGVTLRLAGRADGFDPSVPLLEEIKTCRVKRESITPQVERLHGAQLKLYGGLLCHESPELKSVDLQLTYFHIDSGEEWSTRETHDRAALLEFLDSSVREIGDWLLEQDRWLQRRDANLAALAFPHGQYREGQRQMAELTYQCVSSAGQLLLEAPTGTGKTAAVLFPALKALSTGLHERVCYVTARTVGRRAAEDTLREFENAGMALRRLSITAKESICFSPGRACHGDDCPFAAGYYDRLPAARRAAMDTPHLDRAAIEALAREHDVCPYQLSFDLLPWVDLCIADIHYVYSLGAGISSLFEERGGHWSVLLDEAHNLSPRARDMYSAALDKRELMAARRESRGSLRKALDACNRVFLALNREDWLEPDFDIRDTPPAALEHALQRLVGAVSEQLAEDPLQLQRSQPLLDFYFSVLQFQRVLEEFDGDFRFEMTRGDGQQALSLRLRCLDASRLLGERQRRPRSVTAFSATASPPHWLLTELGFDESAVYRSLPSPFAAQQLRVTLDHTIDIRYRQRQASMPRLAGRVRRWLEEHPGNCIIYFSAYQYMRDSLAAIGEPPSGRCFRVQERSWKEEEKQQLLADLRTRSDVAAFCILGGVFGEGIDLPGEALCSVVVVGVGLPSFSREQEVLREHYQHKAGAGFEFTYQYPGMQRVSQALGRVVRTEADRGEALLIDSRYGNPAYRSLLPPWWDYRFESSAPDGPADALPASAAEVSSE